MSQENTQKLINNLDKFHQQALRYVNEAIFTLNNLRDNKNFIEYNIILWFYSNKSHKSYIFILLIGNRYRLFYYINRIEQFKQMF